VRFDGHGLTTKDTSSDGNTCEINKHYRGNVVQISHYRTVVDFLIP
jgi:hypothetical protein